MRRTERCALFLTTHYRFTLGCFLLVTLVCGWFVRDFAVDASAETLLVKDNQLYLDARRNQQRFSPEEFILVAYVPHAGDIFGTATLADLRSLSAEFAALDRVEKVVSILNVPLLTSADALGPDSDPAQLTLEQGNYDTATLRELFDDHPVFTDLLVNGAQTATALQIVFREDPERTRLETCILTHEQTRFAGTLTTESEAELARCRSEAARIDEALRSTRSAEIAAIYAAVEPYRTRADIHLGGNHVLAEHLVNIIRQDLLVFGTGIAVLIAILLYVVFRDLRWVLLPLLCCGSSVVITMGLFGLLGMKTTVISANFIALQLILTLAIVIHLIVHYQALARTARVQSHVQLLRATVSHKLAPCLYAGLTTSAGFASLLFSGIQPVISFGWMMIVAMATSIAASLILFPCVLMLCRKPLPDRALPLAERCIEVCSGFAERRGWPILLGSLLVLGFSIAGIGRLDVENSFLNYFRDSTQVRQELVFIDQEFGGSTPLDLVFTPAVAGNPDLVLDAATVTLLQRTQATIEGSPAVGKVLSVVNFVELARSLNQGRPLTEYELNTLYLLLDRDLRESLLGAYLDEESGTLRISTRIKDSTAGLNRAEFLQSLQSALEELAADKGSFVVTNLFVLYQDILRRLYESQILTMGLVYLALGILMMLVFRSVRTGLVALVPNVLATLFILGFMGWAGIPLDLMTITISAIAMGIAVDDTIHFVHAFLAHRAEGSQAAIRQAFREVGLALLYTSALIALGFSVLALSDFVPGIYFGLLTGLAMLVALVTDLTLLPVLLLKTHAAPASAAAAPPALPASPVSSDSRR